MRFRILYYSAILAATIASCTNEPLVVKNAPLGERIALYWENTSSTHPERKEWSDIITAHFRENLELYKSAKDITVFCPKFYSIAQTYQIKALGELWSWVAYFESGWDPKVQSVDVGIAEDRNTWSTGLFQMSAADQKKL